MKRFAKTSILVTALCLLACVAIYFTTEPQAATAAYLNSYGTPQRDDGGAVDTRSLSTPSDSSAFIDPFNQPTSVLPQRQPTPFPSTANPLPTTPPTPLPSNPVSTAPKSAPASNFFRFRGVTWGDDRQTVRLTENQEIIAEDDFSLTVGDYLDGLRCSLTYGFVNQTLANARYTIIERHTDKYYHISDYGSIKSLLTQKYGSPARDRVIWKDDRLKDDPIRWGNALGLGHLILSAAWDLPHTTVDLRFEPYADTLKLIIEYRSKAHTTILAPGESRHSLRDL